MRPFCDRKKNDCVNFDVANVIVGVDMKFEKGFTWIYRDTFPAPVMPPPRHYLENLLSTQNRLMIAIPTKYNSRVLLLPNIVLQPISASKGRNRFMSEYY